MKRTKKGLVELIAQTTYEVLSTKYIREESTNLPWSLLCEMSPRIADGFRQDAVPTAEALIQAGLVNLDE